MLLAGSSLKAELQPTASRQQEIANKRQEGDGREPVTHFCLWARRR